MRVLVEVARLAFGTLAFFTLSQIVHFSAFEDGLHLNLSATGAEKVVRTARATSIL